MASVDETEAEVALLRGLDLAGLRARWRAVTGRSAPDHLPRHLIMRMLAYRVQVASFGGLAPESARYLQRLAATTEPVPLPARSQARPGTVLVREWEGVRHHVMAVANGYAWNGCTYRSLSEVARAITGTKWSGPRFFGLRTGSQDRRTA